MVERRKVGNLLALAVLSYLAWKPMHPYELGRTLRDHGDARSIKFNHGSLYMVVQQLARAGFVVAQETTRAGGRPERTVYALTDAGREELHDWLRELVEVPQHEYPQFVAALSLIAALPPDEVVALLDRRLGRLASQRAEVRDLVDQTLAGGVHPLFLIEEEYRLALLEAESAFVARLIQQLDHPDTGWARRWGELQGDPATEERRWEEPPGDPATEERTSS
jgi:DNA-binding PadR family transcriptional regulator